MPQLLAFDEYARKGAEPTGTLAAMYKRLERDRAGPLERARQYCEYTVPSLILPAGATQETELAQPFSSVASRGCTNLSSKLGLVLWPPNTPFVGLEPDPIEMMALEQSDPDWADEVKSSFRSIEDAVSKEIDRRGWRTKLNYSDLLEVITGNDCLWVREDDSLSVYALDRYVAQWDPAGNQLAVIICERIAYSALPPDVRAMVGDKDPNGAPYTNDSVFALYTGAIRQDNGKFSVWQEVEGHEVPGSRRGGYEPNECPIRACRFTVGDPQGYGIGRVELFFGDIKSLDGLSQSLLECAAAAARLVFGVKPACATSPEELNRTPNGGYIRANEGDVFPIAMAAYPQLTTVREAQQDLVRAVSYAFLLHSAVQRDAERVTAEEFRKMAEDLEASLGGAYSSMTQEKQLPLVLIVLGKLQMSRRMPKLPKSVRVKIVTGVEALGRNHALARIQNAVQAATSAGLPPELTMKAIEVTELVRRIFDGAGVETKGLLKSRAQVAQEDQQAQQAALMQKAAPNVVNKVGDAILQANQPSGEVQAPA